MPLPSLWSSDETTRAWKLSHAAGYGAALGAVAALFKMLGPLHTMAVGDGTRGPHVNVPELVAAAIAFALLCAGAAALRNFIVSRLIGQN